MSNYCCICKTLEWRIKPSLNLHKNLYQLKIPLTNPIPVLVGDKEIEMILQTSPIL